MNALALLLLLPLAGSSVSSSALGAPLSATLQDDQPAPSKEVEELVARGRALIALGKGEEARAVLEEADRLDQGALRTRMWLVRALIEKGFLNDALDMTDDLAAAGKQGADLDYLYGMAFVNKARKYIAQGVNLGTVGMHYSDSVDLLRSATELDGAKYADAYLPLAEAAWNSQRLEEARAAARTAVERSSGGAAESFMLGEVAFSQFVAASGDETQQAEADAHWQAAYGAFQAAAKADAAARAKGDPLRRASAHKKSGDALVWKARIEEAAEQYAAAMEFNPGGLPYDQLLGSLGQEQFLAALERGAAASSKRVKADDPSDATLLWWLGWARFTAKDYDGAREAFEKSHAKWPAYTNCLWYVALCRFHKQDRDGAIESVLELQRADPEGLVASINGNPAFHLSILDGLVGHCFNAGRLVDAGRLSAAQGNAAPETTRYWNNVGLFYRDAGDNMPRKKGVVEDPVLQQQYYEKALEGYERALAVEPENPALLNDTAVVLHYNLERDLERAADMYRRSTENARGLLERTDLGQDDRDLFVIALRDSQNNLSKLEALMKRRAKEAEKGAGGEDPAGDPRRR